MDEQPNIALIVARPGPLRNSLYSLMNTLPQITKVAETSDMLSLSRMGSQNQPSLVLLETSCSEGNTREALDRINMEWPATRTVALVDNAAQQRDAESAGADVVLFKGFRAASLIGVVEELLSQAASPQPELPAPNHPKSIGHWFHSQGERR